MMQSHVELMRINFKLEAPILQVHIITYITCYKSIIEMLTYFQYITQDKLM